MKAISLGLLLTCVNLLSQGIFVPPRPGGTNSAAGTNVFAQANFNANQFLVNGTVASIKSGALTTNMSLRTPTISGNVSGDTMFLGGITFDTAVTFNEPFILPSITSKILATGVAGDLDTVVIGTGLNYDSGTFTLSATGSGSQTPWLSDINGAATNRLTNVLSVSADVYYLNQTRTAWISNDTMGNTHFVSSNYSSSGAAPMILNQFQGLLVIPQNILNTNEAADVRAYFNKTVVGTNTYTDAIGLPFMVFNNGREKLVVSNGVGNVHVDANLRVGTNIQAQSATFTGSGSPTVDVGSGSITLDGATGTTTTTNLLARNLTTNRIVVADATGKLINATGTADSTTFLRGDGTLAVPSGGPGTAAFNYFPQIYTNYPLTLDRPMAYARWSPLGTATPLAIGDHPVTPQISGTLTVNRPASLTNSMFGVIRVTGSPLQSAIDQAATAVFSATNSAFLFTATVGWSNAPGTNKMRVSLAGGDNYNDDSTRFGWLALTSGSADTNWVAQYYNGSSFISLHTNAATSGQWHTLGIGNPTGDAVVWYMDGLPVATNSTPGNINLNATGASVKVGSRQPTAATDASFMFWQTMELIYERRHPVNTGPL